jgi:hypothetical protein
MQGIVYEKKGKQVTNLFLQSGWYATNYKVYGL